MRKGRVKITPILIKDSLGFPSDWEIESISYKSTDPYALMVIEGKDFPETTNVEGLEIKNCQIIIHKKSTEFEVKEI